MQKQFELIVHSIFRLLRVSKITYKLSFILVASIIIPMIIFAFLALSISIETDYELVSRGNREVALRTADQIEQYIYHSIDMLQVLAENMNDLHLNKFQKDTIIKNLVLNFKEFDKIAITDRSGMEIVTSEMGGILSNRSEDDAFKTPSQNQIYLSDVFISDNFIPTMAIAVPSFSLNEFDGVVIGTINLINMWRLVDSLTIGKQGYALVVEKNGVLIAHGEGNSKAGIIRQENISHLEIVQEVLSGKASIMEYKNPKGVMVLGAAAPVKLLNWGLIIEQPLSEAYVATYKMAKRLVFLGLVILIVMSFIAYVGVHSLVVRPLKKLIGGIKKKDLSFDKGDEFSNLAEFYNFMSKSVTELEIALEDYSKSSKSEKVTTGLIHDLKHPIDNVIRITKHLAGHIKDKELKKFSRELLEQESKNIHRFISKIKKPMADYSSSRIVGICVSKVFNDLCKSFHKKLKEQNIIVKMELSSPDVFINGDRFNFERVLKNIMVNAMEAMGERGGTLTLSSKNENGEVIVSITDTGPGIDLEKIGNLFVESESGKKEGWGIGLSVSKDLVEKMGGTVAVESALGKGTTFTLKFSSLHFKINDPHLISTA